MDTKNTFSAKRIAGSASDTAECIERLREEIGQLEKNCTQIYDAMKKAEAEAKFFRTLVQSHRPKALPNVASETRRP